MGSTLPPPRPRAHAAATLQPGDVFDRYRIEGSLGRGGMGHVYSAFDTKLRRWVALKLLHPAVTSDPFDGEAAAARLVAEGRAAANLSHPNVVTVFDVGEVEGVPFLAMELVLGRTLGVAARGAGWSVIMPWLEGLAAGIAAAHRAGVVHGDVKPDNVIVRDDGRVCVLDFGTARRDAWMGECVSTGTLAYMAPEQFSAWRPDGRADQFAWGVTAYEALTGRLPWPLSQSVPGLVAAILAHEPTPVGQLVPGLPPAIASAIMRALAKDPGARFSSMEELAMELGAR